MPTRNCRRQVNSILCASRFAHLIKVMGRDMVGSFQTADEIERKLQNWLQGYVNTNITGSGDARARFPLVAGMCRCGRSRVKPGVFGWHRPGCSRTTTR